MIEERAMARFFDGKVAVVTGAASGIGRATSLKFAAEGAKVVLGDIDETEANNTLDMIVDSGGQGTFTYVDVTRSGDVEAMVETVVNHYGRLDVAFNNAGSPGRFTDAVGCTEEEFDSVTALNTKSVWLCMKYEIPAMLKSGGGAIVNTASTAAVHPSRHMVSYVSTKAAVIGLTRSAAVDFADRNIRVNALLPGPTETPMLMRGAAGLKLDGVADFSARVPMNRIAAADEQASVVAWLCSDQASYMTGISVPVDGGKNLI
jgi:NAD(P)-dependent dehydrogenase (short-subunit alcohol dehydrogenase family)